MENGKQGAFATRNHQGYQKGLTKREYFAGLAMQGLLSNTDVNTEKTFELAFASIKLSDELLKQLEK